MKTMTLDELKKLPPLSEERLAIIKKAKPTPDEDCPEQTEEQLKQFRPWYEVHPDWYKPKKSDVHIKIDTDVLQWFKRQGKGYQTKINAVLREYAFAR